MTFSRSYPARTASTQLIPGAVVAARSSKALALIMCDEINLLPSSAAAAPALIHAPMPVSVASGPPDRGLGCRARNVQQFHFGHARGAVCFTRGARRR